MNQDLKIIKKKYGERMAHFCREYFPSLLEREGLLLDLMLNNFEPNHNLYDDIIKQKKEDEFKNYIYSLVDVEKNNEIKVIKTPEELLSEAGYDLYECKSEEDIQSFKKYYSKNEELCTFNGGRLDRCYVFFAVKKNVDKIKRENYPNPKRQDEYGTSVISIQFTKDISHTLSIKNRYNHHVSNPDSTFSNNLDNIIEGLTESFGKCYGLVQQHSNNKFELDGYVKANDNKYYKYNYEIMNVYYCLDNIIIDNFEVKRYEKEKYIIFDYFILDLVNKELRLYDQNVSDSFPNTITSIQEIEVKRKDGEKELKITLQNNSKVIIILDKDNRMIKLESNIKRVEGHFLYNNKFLKEISFPLLEKVGRCFLFNNSFLEKLNLPVLEYVGDDFLCDNKTLKKVDLPKLRIIKDEFLFYNRFLKEINMPSLEKVGNYFLCYNITLEKLNLPSIEEIGDGFLFNNNSLLEINLPVVEEVGNAFLFNNNSLLEINLPSLKIVGDNFFINNNVHKKCYFPLLEKIGLAFLDYHLPLTEEDIIAKFKR